MDCVVSKQASDVHQEVRHHTAVLPEPSFVTRSASKLHSLCCDDVTDTISDPKPYDPETTFVSVKVDNQRSCIKYTSHVWLENVHVFISFRIW